MRFFCCSDPEWRPSLPAPVAAMFRPTSPQLSLLESRFLVGTKKRERLERSWAEAFRTKILPLIEEEAFRACFHEDNGRPNKSIRLLVGLHILKEADDLTDEQILDALEFNIQWQHALGVEPSTAHVCEKTLHNFRHKLLENERAQGVLEQVTSAMMTMDGLSAVRQRLDSTHVISNIAVLTRLGLFTETVTVFLRELRKEAPGKLAKLDSPLLKRYLDREGYFSDATREQAQRRLPVVAQDLYFLVRRFETDEVVKALPSYALLVRLLADQCNVTGGETETPAVTVKEGKEVAGSSLQSPHDSDATYGHKGKGYEAQVAETCVKENPYQVITAVALNGANESDQNATLPIVERLVAHGHKPDEMLADTGYGSGENIIGCAEMGVILFAPVQDPDKPKRQDLWIGPPALEAPATAATSESAVPPAEGASDPVAPAAPAPTAGPTSETASVADSVAPAPKVAMTLGDFAFNATFSDVIRCPNGAGPTEQRSTDTAYYATFRGADCATCTLAEHCITRRIAHSEDRTLRWRDTRAATETRQREQQTPAFKGAYKLRSGIESTNAELKGRHGLGALRVRTQTRVELAVVLKVLKALALNVKRSVQHHTERIRAALDAPNDAGMAPA